MKTYQDLLQVSEKEEDRIQFVRACIDEHKSSEDYKMAVIAQEYDKRKNITILAYQKVLYNLAGQSFLDEYTPNHKMCSGFFPRFVTQQNQFLLGNGVSWNDKESVSKKIGKKFDSVLNNLGRYAIVDGVSFGFFNLDKVMAFRLTEFKPLWDEEDGALKAGIRFWQIDEHKPLRATLYELDGYTEYIWNKEFPQGAVKVEKRSYVLVTKTTPADGEEIIDSYNYPTFPIIPLYCNKKKQSEFVGFREDVDTYDLIKAGFANTVDESSIIYWTVQNAGGMDDIDLVKMLDKIRKLHAVNVGEGDEDSSAKLESHQLDAPYESREALLTRLEGDMYDSYGALNIKDIIGGANTATQIKAAYIPVDDKADEYEYCILDFLEALMILAGIENETPSFTRNYLINKTEEVATILQASMYLPRDYVVKKLLILLGDPDLVNEILDQLDEEGASRFKMSNKEPNPQE